MEKEEMSTQLKPSIFIAMPCYDSVKINTMLSIFKLIQQLSKSGIEVGINTMRSPLIHQARNYLTSIYLTTDYTHLLFIDSDIQFEAEAVMRMLVAKKDVICTPYRVKSANLSEHLYPVAFKDSKKIMVLAGGLIEVESGPTGLMLIHRKVFEKIMKNSPELKIKNQANQGLIETEKSHSFYYNFFDFGFEDGLTSGEDFSFCKLVRKNDIKIYANVESSTGHEGSHTWTGKFADSLKSIKSEGSLLTGK